MTDIWPILGSHNVHTEWHEILTHGHNERLLFVIKEFHYYLV